MGEWAGEQTAPGLRPFRFDCGRHGAVNLLESDWRS